MLLISVLPAPAAEESGSLRLRCVFPVGDGERVLSNDEYSLVKIADAVITDDKVTYMTLEAFKSYDCDWTSLSASKMNAKAKALAYYCEKDRYYTDSAVTGSGGECFFDRLGIGLYLVSRTKTDAANLDFTTDPLLFFMPQNVNGVIEYDVVATPKFSYISPGNPPDGSNGGGKISDDVLPQTGQLMWPVTLLAVLGCFLILVGSFLMRKEGLGEKKGR
jgi:hypothetical protein